MKLLCRKVDRSLYICPNPQNVQCQEQILNCGFWVIIICQCRFISCNKYTTLVRDFDSRGGCVHVKKRVYGDHYLLLNFAVKSKTLKSS